MVNTRNNTTEAIPVHRIALLRPVVRLLTDVGTPVERCFRQVGLPWYALEDVDNYVPSQRFYKFLVSTAYSEGIMDLGFRVGKKFGADCADPHMTKLLKNAPTLYQGLLKASERINQTVTHVRFGILQPANCRYTYFYMHPSCKVDNPAIEQVGWYGITILLGMVRAYTGPQWQPTEIGVTKDRMPCGYIREHFPHTRIRLSQPFCYIALENAVLSLPPFQDEAARLASSLNDYRKIPEDFVSSLELVLLSYLQEGNMSIELAAELCNTSKRTLQRKLKEVGTHYNEVVDHARFRATSRMLQDANMTVNDIRYRLGYSNVANFARSFQRIAGVTPQVYRQQFNH